MIRFERASGTAVGMITLRIPCEVTKISRFMPGSIFSLIGPKSDCSEKPG